MKENTERTGKGIKTREVKHDVKVLDKSAEMAKSLKNAAVRTNRNWSSETATNRTNGRACSAVCITRS